MKHICNECELGKNNKCDKRNAEYEEAIIAWPAIAIIKCSSFKGERK